MLTKLILKNFQKWKRVTIPLSKITTFIGPTNSGKSSLIRALGWVSLNNISGDAFILHDEEDCSATLVIDSKKITRKKGKQGNIYLLDKKEFRAFGQGNVPEEINNLLSLSDMNFQFQLDSHFWLSESAGKVSRELNAIVDLAIIDQSLSNIAREVKKASLALEIGKERLQKAQEEKQSLSWVSEYANRVNTITKKNKALSATRLERSIIESVCNSIQIASERLPSLKRAYNASKRYVSVISKLLAITEKRKTLESLLDQIDQKEKRIEWLRNESTKLRKQLQVDQCPLCGQKMNHSSASKTKKR